MEISLFASWKELISGLFVGMVFGFLLRKAGVTRFTVIVKQLLLQNFTVMKVMISAIMAGSVGIALLRYFQPDLPLDITATTFLTAILGGAVFGIGMAMLGYCPGTAVGALADGAKDVWFGILGMIAGAALYAESAEWIQSTIKPSGKLVKTTLPEYFGISQWTVIGILFAVAALYLLIGRVFFQRSCAVDSKHKDRLIQPPCHDCV